jgi:hypothetical protein
VTEPVTEPETEPVTEPETEPVTEPETKSEQKPNKKGCFSVIDAGLTVMLLTGVLGGAILLRKRED